MKSIRPSERRRARWLETAVAGCPSASDNSAMLRSLSIRHEQNGHAVGVGDEFEKGRENVWFP